MVERIDYIKDLCKQLKDTLHADTAILDKYGFILSSYIEEFKEGDVISPTLLNFFTSREKVALELNSQKISSILLYSEETNANLVFTFGKHLILMSKLEKHVDLDEYLPSINRFLALIDKEAVIKPIDDFIKIDTSKENEYISTRLEGEGKSREGRFKIFKDIVRKMAQM
jgi:hypothetical protein